MNTPHKNEGAQLAVRTIDAHLPGDQRFFFDARLNVT
jgi:hypothetical protein